MVEDILVVRGTCRGEGVNVRTRNVRPVERSINGTPYV